jgi:hypothetical protein
VYDNAEPPPGSDRLRGQSMTSQALQSRDPDILAADAALRRAARQAQALGRRTGAPVYVLKDGRIVDLTREWKKRGPAPGSTPEGRLV